MITYRDGLSGRYDGQPKLSSSGVEQLNVIDSDEPNRHHCAITLPILMFIKYSAAHHVDLMFTLVYQHQRQAGPDLEVLRPYKYRISQPLTDNSAV